MSTRLFTARPLPLLLGLMLILAQCLMGTFDAHGRAGSGQSYRSSSSSSSSRSSSSSSSSYRSSSSSTYRSPSGSFSRSTSSSSRSSSPPSSGGSSSSSASSLPVEYTDDYVLFGYSSAITVNRDATAEITESFDVSFPLEHCGITRSLNTDYLGTIVLIADVSSPQGYASYEKSSSGGTMSFGYRGKRVTGRQTFVVKYRVTGAVLPHGAGAQFLWRTLVEKEPLVSAITVNLPAGPTAARAVMLPSLGGKMLRETELACEIAGTAVRIPVNRQVTGSVDLAVTLGPGAVEAPALRKALDVAMDMWNDIRVGEYRTRVVMRNDRTMERTEDYRKTTSARSRHLEIPYGADYHTNAVDEQSADDRYITVWNRFYLYAFEKKSCRDQRDYSSWEVCVPFDDPAATERNATLRYSLWGNFNPGEPHFIDLRLPAARVDRVDSLRAEILLPAGLKPETITPRVYLLRPSIGSFIMVHSVTGCHRFEGSRLIIDCPGGLYQGQYLLVRLFAPAAAFTAPSLPARVRIFLSYQYHFNAAVLFAVIALVVLLVAGGAVAAAVIRRKRAGRISPPTVPAPVCAPADAAAPSLSAEQAAVATVKTEDPSFDPQIFLSRVHTIVRAIQEAWCRGDMASVRNFVSQGVYNRFRLQLRLLREQDQTRNHLGDFSVQSLELTTVSLSKEYHTLHVSVKASARDVTVPLALSADDAARALAAAPVTPFTEIYSLTRKRGARTDAAKNLYSGQCPACGTIPPKFGDTNKCPSCGSIYNSGEFDWVLSEITQAGEWKDSSAVGVPGLPELEDAGLSMNRGVIEDRASYLFWRWLACRAAGSAAALARDATAGFLGGFTPAGEFLGSAAVGAVDLREVTVSGEETRARVLVLWSAATAPGREPQHHEHLLGLVLPRRQKNPYGFADHSCDTCGAPLPESDALKCAYCSSDLQKVNSDWLLDGVESQPS